MSEAVGRPLPAVSADSLLRIDALAHLRRAAPTLLYVVAVLVGVVAVVGPDALAWQRGFIAWRPPFDAAIPPGDHLQTVFNFWLWKDSLFHGRLPFTDVYHFAATGHLARQPFGWPLVLLAVPVMLLWGPVAAYNVVVVAAFVGAALATSALVVELGGSRPAGAVAGFAFAFAPFRLVQGTMHANALVAPMFPLVLLFVERALTRREGKRWAWAAVAAHISLIACGEFHFILYGTALTTAYIAVRAPRISPQRLRRLKPQAVALVVGTVAVVALEYIFVLRPSTAGKGRSLDEAALYAPRWDDFVRRAVSWNPERYVYPGLVIVVAAVVGVVVLMRNRRRRFFAVAGSAGVLLAALVATGPGMEGAPVVQWLIHEIVGLGTARVPGRIMLLAALLLAVFAGFAVDLVRDPRTRWRVAAVLVIAMLVDAPKNLYREDAATSPGLAAMDVVPAGSRILDLPAFRADGWGGSLYAYLVTRTPGPRAGGYSPFVTDKIAKAQHRTQALSNATVDPCKWKSVVEDFRLQYVIVHGSLYGPKTHQWPGDPEQLVRALKATPGLEQVAAAGDTTVFLLHADRFECATPG